MCLIAEARIYELLGREQSEFCIELKLAEGEFLAGIGRQGKPEDGHAGN